MPGKAYNSARKSCLFCWVFTSGPTIFPQHLHPGVSEHIAALSGSSMLDRLEGSSSQAYFCLCLSSSWKASSTFLLPCVPALHLSKTLPHLLEMCITQKRYDTLEWFFQLPRFPLRIGKTFRGTHYQNSAPVFVFPSWGLFGCHQPPTRVDSSRIPIRILPQSLLDQSVFASHVPSRSLLLLFQDSRISQRHSSLLPPPFLLNIPFPLIFPAAASVFMSAWCLCLNSVVSRSSWCNIQLHGYGLWNSI